MSDGARGRTACTTRRAGKTSAFVRDAVRESWANPNASVVYLNETRDRAKRTFWEELKSYVETQGLPYKANESELCLKGPSNRWIWVGGGDSKKHVNRWKGILPKAAAFYVDESQDWRYEVIKHVHSEVIGPSLADMGGRVTFGGVPGPIPDAKVSYWYALTQNQSYSHHGTDEHPWTLWTNPHIKDGYGALLQAMTDRGVGLDDPTIQREFFGRWILDKNALVFGEVDDLLNVVASLPDDVLNFVAGADFGEVDSSSLQVIGWQTAGSKLYVAKNLAWSLSGPTYTIERIKEELRPLSGGLLAAVGDPGGGGKGMMDDLSKLGVTFENAEKTEKVTACRLLADAIRRRDLLFDGSNPETSELIRDLRRVEWHPEHRGQRLKGHTPDRVDALLYAFRKAWQLFFPTLPRAAAPMTDEDRREADRDELIEADNALLELDNELG